MKKWIKAPINLTITAFLAALSYVTLVSSLNKGIGLGEPMWLGFLNQVVFHFIFIFIALIILIGPLYFILDKFMGKTLTSLIIGNVSIFSSIFVLFVFVVSVDGYWLGIFVPCIVGVVSFSIIEHLTRHSNGTPQSDAP